MENLLNQFFNHDDVINGLINNRLDKLSSTIEWLKKQSYYKAEINYTVEFYHSLKNIPITSLYGLEDVSKKIDQIEQLYDKVLRKVHRYRETLILKETINFIQNDIRADLTDEEKTTIELFKKQLEAIIISPDFNVEDVENIKTALKNISIKLYKQQLTEPQDYVSGEPFMFVVHNLTGRTDIKSTDEFYRESFLSTSLITDKEMGLYGGKKVGFIYPVDNNLLVADSKDVQSYNRENNTSLEYIGQYDKPTTKPPVQIEKECMQQTLSETGEILNYGADSNVYSELVLDIRGKKPTGIFCITNGEKELNSNYVTALRLSVEFNLPLIDIDMSIYRSKNGLEPLTESAKKQMTINMLYFFNKDLYYDLGKRQKIAEIYYEQIFSAFWNLKNSNQYSKDKMIAIIDSILNHKPIEELSKNK